MKLLYGLCDQALLQRDSKDLCHCTFGAKCVGELRSSLGKITPLDKDTYRLSDIPVGGPYSVILSDDTDHISLTLWVGDLWLLGGQSNMEGAGYFTEEDFFDEAHPLPEIRAFYLDDRWDVALPLLHESWKAKDACIREVFLQYQLNSPWHSDLPPFLSYGTPKRGIGPGLSFAKRLYEITHVPQGVIPCALGGSCMNQWNPDGKDNLYCAMIRRLQCVGGKVRGLFWYQGCSDCSPDGVTHFTERMKHLIASLRRDCKDDTLPVVQVQIAKNTFPDTDPARARCWEAIRELQRTMDRAIPYLDTVTAMDSAQDDMIHLSSASQRKVGLRGAESMAALCGFGGHPAPKLRSIQIRQSEYVPFWGVVSVTYDHVDALTATFPAVGFALTKTAEELVLSPNARISKIRLDGNTVHLYTELTIEELPNYYLHYGYLNMGHCSIGANNGHALPAMGPLKIIDYLEEASI